MRVETYLKELALNNRRVILPDLGAFLLKENSEGTRSIIFSSFLRYNDGFLEEAIAEKANLSKSDASFAVKKLVNEIKKVLNTRKPFLINDFGYFSLDEKGVIQFEPDEKIIYAPPVTNKVTEPEITEEIKNATQEETAEPEVIEEIVPPQKTDFIQPENIQPITPELHTEEEPVENTPKKERISNQEKKSSPEFEIVKDSEKKRKQLWIIIFLLVVIVFLLSLLYLCTTNSDLCFLRKPAKTTLQLPVVTPPDMPVKNITGDSVKMLSTPVVTNNNNLQYYVIAGCFSEKINAERFLQHCLAQGYTATEILPKIGELYPVAIAKSPNAGDAEQILKTYNDKYEAEAWLYRTY